MIFAPDLCAKVLDGSKTQTRRPVRPGVECRYRVGSTYAVQYGRGQRGVARILVLSCERVSVGSITREDARAEGFRDADAFYARWRELYGGVFGHCWRIEFELSDVAALPFGPV